MVLGQSGPGLFPERHLYPSDLASFSSVCQTLAHFYSVVYEAERPLSGSPSDFPYLG